MITRNDIIDIPGSKIREKQRIKNLLSKRENPSLNPQNHGLGVMSACNLSVPTVSREVEAGEP